MTYPAFILLMGPSGCGKSTVGPLLAERIGGVFLEGDDFHPPANKVKMGSGTPLVDEDRWPWFENLRAEVAAAMERHPGRPVIASCSALKVKYRAFILDGYGDTARMVFLRGPKDLIAGRIAAREHEYMPATLLDSQFAALEEPLPEENAIVLDIAGTPGEIADQVAERLGAGSD